MKQIFFNLWQVTDSKNLDKTEKKNVSLRQNLGKKIHMFTQ